MWPVEFDVRAAVHPGVLANGIHTAGHPSANSFICRDALHGASRFPCTPTFDDPTQEASAVAAHSMKFICEHISVVYWAEAFGRRNGIMPKQVDCIRPSEHEWVM